jgi:aspartate ammonia-lyase
MGRTENQDAVPMTLGQEFSTYAVMIESAAAGEYDGPAEDL